MNINNYSIAQHESRLASLRNLYRLVKNSNRPNKEAYLKSIERKGKNHLTRVTKKYAEMDRATLNFCMEKDAVSYDEPSYYDDIKALCQCNLEGVTLV